MDAYKATAKEWGRKARKAESRQRRVRLKAELHGAAQEALDELAEAAAYAPCSAYPDCEVCGCP